MSPTEPTHPVESDPPKKRVSWWRGFTRLYLVLSVFWVGWSLYKPFPDWRDTSRWMLDRYNEGHQLCDEKDAERQKEFEKERDLYIKMNWDPVKLYARHMGETDSGMACLKVYEHYTERFHQMASASNFQIYQETGFGRIAAYSLLPPIAGYAFAFALMVTFKWVRAGFSV